MMRLGCGEATTLRQPRPASSLTVHPSVAASSFALPPHLRADRLAGIGERGIVAVDDHLRDHGDHLACEPPAPEFVVERALEHVADRALGVRIRIIHRHLGHLALGHARAPQDEAHLRPVAVGQDYGPTRRHHVGHVMRGRRGGVELVRDRLVLLVDDQRVASHCDDGCTVRVRHAIALGAVT
jgi:hypothetical protein